MNKKIPESNFIFFYDGECKFCRGLAFKLIKLNIDKKLKFKSFRKLNQKELLEIHPELSEEVLEGEVQLIFNNKRFPGFFAVRKIIPFLRIYWIITPILYLPLVPLVGMLVMVLLKRKKNKNNY